MAKKLLLLLVVAFALVVAGCWWFAERAAPADGAGYTLAPLERGRAAETVSATGVVQPRDLYYVGAELPGRIVEVRADFNQEVGEGDLLARLDSAAVRQRLKQTELGEQEAQAGLRQAESARDAAATAVQREQERSPEIRRPIDMDIVRHQLKSSEAGVEAARVKVREAEEAHRQAEDDLGRTEIRAPVLADGNGASSAAPANGVGALAADGAAPGKKHRFTILDRAVSVDQIVGPPASARLFTLADGLEHLEIDVQVAEADVGRVASGQTADVKGPGGDDEPAFAGRVREVRLTPGSEHGAVFYKAVVDVTNERDAASHEWKLRPGMTANVDVLVRTHEDVWKMPAAALTFQPDPATLTDATRAKLARLQAMKNHDWWRPVWVPGPDHKPYPVFVRTGGRNARGETGIQTAEYSEVLEWDAEIQPPAEGEAPYSQLIIGAPPPARSFFSIPKVKL